jgi:L-ribulose-5-phosphate 3-epimerase
MANAIACGTSGYPEADLDRVLLGLAKAGFHYVELAATPSAKARIKPEEMSAADIQNFRAKLASYGLTPISVSGHSNLATPEGVSQFKARIDFAAALEVGIINTGTGHTSNTEEEDRFFELMTSDVIPFAQARGVKVALETHGGLTGTAEDCLKTLERLNSPQVGINYDPANVIYYRGVRPEQDLPLIAAQVIHFHLKDQRGGQGLLTFPVLGEGEIDFAQLRDTLAQVGYQGPYSAELELHEPLTPAGEDEARLRTRQYMEKLLA